MVEKKKEYRLWQLWVKKRLDKHNREMVIQLDRDDRIEKLEQALSGVEADYARLLRAADSRSQPKLAVERVVRERRMGRGLVRTMRGKMSGNRLQRRLSLLSR